MTGIRLELLQWFGTHILQKDLENDALAGTIVVQDSIYKITFILLYLISFLHLFHRIKMFNMARVSLYIIFVSLIYLSI